MDRLFWLSFTGMLSHAQRPIDDGRRADSLEAVLTTSRVDTVKIDALHSLSNYWLYKDSAKAMDYALRAETASLRIKDNFRIALSHFYIGNVYMEFYALTKATDELAQCIRDALADKLVLSEDVQAILARLPDREPEAGIPRLTRREKEILKMIAGGNTTAEMATQLFLSPFTVETHRRNLMQKFGVGNAPALIRMATELRLI